MVTTRGTRAASSVLEEPLAVLPRSRKRGKKELHADAKDSNLPNGRADILLRKRRSGAGDSLSTPASISPETKRVKTQSLPSSPELKKHSKTSSPSVARRRSGNPNKISEGYSEEVVKVEQDSTEAVENLHSEDTVLADADSQTPALRASLLSKQSNAQHLSLFEQFEHLLAQAPIYDLELHQQQSLIRQIIQWWESSGQHTSEVKPYATVVGVSKELRTAAIPVLSNIAAQVLHVFAYYNPLDVWRATALSGSHEGRIWGIYQTLFRIVKNLYPMKNGFIYDPDLPKQIPQGVAAFGMANMATFVSTCFGIKDVGFFYLHEHFFDIFSNTASNSVQQKLRIYLEIKTQGFLAAIHNGERAKALVLAEMFPEDMESVILRFQPASVDLLSGGDGFLAQAQSCRAEFESSSTDETSLAKLTNSHPYARLLQLLAGYVDDHFSDLGRYSLEAMAPLCDPTDTMRPVSTDTIQSSDVISAIGKSTGRPRDFEELHRNLGFPDNEIQSQIPNYAHPDPPDPPPPPEPEHVTIDAPTETTTPSSADDIRAQAANAARQALLGISQSRSEESSILYGQGPVASPAMKEVDQSGTQERHDIEESSTQVTVEDNPTANGPRPSHQHSIYPPSANDNHAIKQSSITTDSPYLQKHQQANLAQGSYYQASGSAAYGPPGQSQPTAVLYERARQVANSKSSTLSRNKTSNVSQRRPWTLEEEQALMDGLDQVKGPHWSQILVLYGPGGSINETLRDRTQVQLKDKARNLKLFFLKSKIEVPYYLSFVTGELKSRAPSHVSTYDDTPPRSIAFSNGGHLPPSTSRNRPIPPSAHISHSTMFNPMLHLPQTNGTYSSPYAALPGSQPPPEEEQTDLEPTEIDDASHQNVADLADSAAAQVRAALANFNAMDLPNFDGSAPMDSLNDATAATDPMEGVFTEPEGGTRDEMRDGTIS